MSGRVPLFHTGDGGVRNRELTSLHCAGAEETCLHHTLIEALPPQNGDCTEPVGAPCDLETYRCPRPVLFKEVAEQCLFASEDQVRVRGSTRPACSAIVR